MANSFAFPLDLDLGPAVDVGFIRVDAVQIRFAVEEDVTAKITSSCREFMYGAYQIISPRPFHRTIGAAPDVRDDGTHTNINETIDANVFKRPSANT